MQLRQSDIVTAALQILDTYSLADLTMRRLASALRVQPGALYWHFPNKQALLAAVADRILTPLSHPTTSTEPLAQLRESAQCFRECLLRYRDGAELVSATFAARHRNQALDNFTGFLAQLGLSPRDAETAAGTLAFFILGHALDEQGRIQLDSAGALLDENPDRFETNCDTDSFEFGLQLFLGGVHRLVISPNPVPHN